MGQIFFKLRRLAEDRSGKLHMQYAESEVFGSSSSAAFLPMWPPLDFDKVQQVKENLKDRPKPFLFLEAESTTTHSASLRLHRLAKLCT
ncbi:hypothetical protein PGT21_024594 [Puccinia graminis f. sp. tritici]|uniref:Uncharacterized protein n=1 Tax=Puccinia graminis f. sp. tritici TaxID=56615 RepID=A0A5B0PYG6_PUCGR|nr:hypothetical protein PGT21_024594 [Puccinia graminis f. sp. tritici]